MEGSEGFMLVQVVLSLGVDNSEPAVKASKCWSIAVLVSNTIAVPIQPSRDLTGPTPFYKLSVYSQEKAPIVSDCSSRLGFSQKRQSLLRILCWVSGLPF